MTENWEEIYRAAVYAVIRQGSGIKFKVGENSTAIDEILTENNAQTFALITAHNPYSQKLSDKENHSRQTKLIKVLEAVSYTFLQGYSTNANESWEREESLFVLNISKDAAIKIAQDFEQNAILFGRKGSKTKLIWC